jgi:hypothetical protein
MAEKIEGRGWRSFLEKYKNGEIPTGSDIRVYNSRGDGLIYYKVSNNGNLRFYGIKTGPPESVIGDKEWEMEYKE